MIAVVIPIYRSVPPPLEIVSLVRCCNVLDRYDFIFVSPAGLDVSWYREICGDKVTATFEQFDKAYFADVEGYSRLLLSTEFYSRFLKYEFILIHQLDAYVLSNNVDDWCEKNYDYIGAPWLESAWHEDVLNGIKVTIFRQQNFLMRQWTKIKWKLGGLSKPDRLRVGNGGFSLRKVKTFHDILLVTKKPEGPMYNEDLFWSIYVPLMRKDFRIADWQTALGFCFDSKPALCYSLTGGQLPFAAHGWFRDDDVYTGNADFWKTFIKY